MSKLIASKEKKSFPWVYKWAKQIVKPIYADNYDFEFRLFTASV